LPDGGLALLIVREVVDYKWALAWVAVETHELEPQLSCVK